MSDPVEGDLVLEGATPLVLFLFAKNPNLPATRPGLDENSGRNLPIRFAV
jgi:hypothetical protein